MGPMVTSILEPAAPQVPPRHGEVRSVSLRFLPPFWKTREFWVTEPSISVHRSGPCGAYVATRGDSGGASIVPSAHDRSGGCTPLSTRWDPAGSAATAASRSTRSPGSSPRIAPTTSAMPRTNAAANTTAVIATGSRQPRSRLGIGSPNKASGARHLVNGDTPAPGDT